MENINITDKDYQEFLKWRSNQKATSKKLPTPYEGGEPNNVLIIGDLHEPFCLKGYLEFCRMQQEMYNCGTVVFIGDVIDNHYSSYHETDPDGMSAVDELDRAINKIQNWYKVFPEAHVLIGNHDRIIARKAVTAGISSRWVRDYSEVLETPGWKFVEELEINDVTYIHGEGGTARTKMKKELQSIVQGHLHSQAYIEFIVGKKFKIFGMQVGCGIDRLSYAMAYGKTGPKPVISCGVVLDRGTQPIIIPMEL